MISQYSVVVVYSNCDVLLVCTHAKNHGEVRVFKARDDDVEHPASIFCGKQCAKGHSIFI